MKNDFKQTPLGALPKTWEVVRLGEIAEFLKGAGISKENISSQGIPCVRYGELYTTYKEVINFVYSKTNLDKSNLILSQKNDILMPTSGETAIDIAKASCILVNECAIGGDINIIRTKQNGIYLSYLLSNAMKKEIASLAQGATIIHLYAKTLSNLQIPLPPLKEQEKIAGILSAADDKLHTLEKLIKTKELYKKALMQKLFSRKLRFKEFCHCEDDHTKQPMPRHCEHSQNVKQSRLVIANEVKQSIDKIIDCHEFDKSNSRNDDWKSVRLGEVIKHFGGKPLEKEVSKNGNYKFISIGNYSPEGKYIDNKQRVFLNNNTKDKLLTRGDLVMVLNDKTSDGKILGSTIYIDKDDEYIYNQRSERIICLKEAHPVFMWFLLNSADFRKQIFAISQGGTQIYVNFPSVKQIVFSLPSLAEQEKIAGILSAADEEINTLKKKFECLKLQKKALMQQLLSGKMRVKI